MSEQYISLSNTGTAIAAYRASCRADGSERARFACGGRRDIAKLADAARRAAALALGRVERALLAQQASRLAALIRVGSHAAIEAAGRTRSLRCEGSQTPKRTVAGLTVPFALCVPTGQGLQTLEPGVAVNEPGSQPVQLAELGTAAKVPTMHCKHLVLPVWL